MILKHYLMIMIFSSFVSIVGMNNDLSKSLIETVKEGNLNQLKKMVASADKQTLNDTLPFLNEVSQNIEKSAHDTLERNKKYCGEGVRGTDTTITLGFAGGLSLVAGGLITQNQTMWLSGCGMILLTTNVACVRIVDSALCRCPHTAWATEVKQQKIQKYLQEISQQYAIINSSDATSKSDDDVGQRNH